MKNKKKVEEKKNYISVISVIVVILLFAVIYELYAQRQNFKASNDVSPNWNIAISDIYSGDAEGNASLIFKPKIIGNNKILFGTNLINKGDSITYTVTVKNKGNIDAYLKDIKIENTTNDKSIKYDISGVVKDLTRLNIKKNNIIKVRVYYDGNSKDENVKTDELSVEFIYKEDKE